MSSPEKIEQFWAWFGEAEERLGEALRDPAGRRTAIDEVHMRLHRLGLHGDVVPQADGTELIVGSPRRDAEHRIVAAHWLIGAPESERFAFATHSPAQPVQQLMEAVAPGDPPLPIAAMRWTAQWRETQDLVDLTAWVGEGVPALRAQQLAPAVLRGALGELEMECWVGSITITGFAPAGALSLAELMAALEAEIAVRAEPRWEQFETVGSSGSPRRVTVRRPIQPARHPFLDACVTIRTELLPDDPEGAERIQRQLLDGIPGDVLPIGDAIDGQWRTAFIYANRRSPSLGMLKARAEMLGGEFASAWDPGWEQARQLQRRAR